MYKIKYLDAALLDIIDIAVYITNELNNPTAADRLMDKITSAANKLCDFPHINPVYHPVEKLDHEYRKLFVKNYIVFYFIDETDKVVFIARVIYGRRDYEKLL